MLTLEPKTETSEVTSVVCLANSIVITVYILLSLTFLLGVICGLIAEYCVCALLKRKAKWQSKVSFQREAITQIIMRWVKVGPRLVLISTKKSLLTASLGQATQMH